MPNDLRARDWFVIILIALVVVAGTVYLYRHPSDVNFGVWCSFITTIGSIYHWLVLHDQKVPDAC